MENLELIDWKMVGFASLWILGLAILLTALGFADYHAKLEDTRIRSLMRRPTYQLAVNFGLSIFCLGLLGSAKVLWETALWILLAAAFAFFSFKSWRQLRVQPVEGEIDDV